MWFRDIFRRRDPERDPAPGPAPDDGLSDLTFLRRLDRLALRTSRFLRGDAAGQRPSLRRLPSNDFREHRLYLPGDDLRRVDWNVSARAEHVFVKLGEQPKEATVHILLDNSASMNWGRPSKWRAARRLAAGLGYLALGHGDRAAITPLAENAPAFGPSQGKGRLAGMVRYLRGLPVAPRANLGAAVRRYAARQARGGFAILISDLIGAPAPGPDPSTGSGQSLTTLLDYFPLPKWQALVLHLLHPAELAPALKGEVELEDAETGARANYDLTPAALEQYAAFVREWCDAVERACYEETVAYARVLADWPLEQMVMPYLRQRGVVVG
jgi:uncharacterized protein (DUF58 family)